jgi:hypothetical protein
VDEALDQGHVRAGRHEIGIDLPAAGTLLGSLLLAEGQ